MRAHADSAQVLGIEFEKHGLVESQSAQIGTPSRDKYWRQISELFLIVAGFHCGAELLSSEPPPKPHSSGQISEARRRFDSLSA